MAEDRREALSFAPIDGATYRERLSEKARRTMPDSITVIDERGQVLTRAAAVASVLATLGGLWRVAGLLLDATPRRLSDSGYRLIAHVRRGFGRLKNACPMVSVPWRVRLLP